MAKSHTHTQTHSTHLTDPHPQLMFGMLFNIHSPHRIKENRRQVERDVTHVAYTQVTP